MVGAKVQQRFGKAVKAARQQLGYSQEAFAAELGMHRTQLGHIEQGLKDCRLSTIGRIRPQVLGWEPRHVDVQVDAVQQRAGHPASIATHQVRPTTTAAARIARPSGSAQVTVDDGQKAIPPYFRGFPSTFLMSMPSVHWMD